MIFGYMLYQRCRFVEAFSANLASEHFLLQMESDVLVQIRLLTVTLVAEMATEFLVSGMHFRVNGQTGCLRERFIAVFALEWLKINMAFIVSIDLGTKVTLNTFSPVWIRMWVLRLPGCVNDFSQIEHWNGCN